MLATRFLISPLIQSKTRHQLELDPRIDHKQKGKCEKKTCRMANNKKPKQ